MIDLQPLFITLKLATITTFVLLIVSLPLSVWLANGNSRFTTLVQAVISMPLILPPTVIGFYLLIFLGPNHFFGQIIDQWFGIRLVFSFMGLVIGSFIYSLPFMVHPVVSGINSLPPGLLEVSYTLGKSKWATFFLVTLPCIRNSVLTGIVLTFAHTIGEFGIVMMIGGNIPGQTKVASVAIFDEVEAMNYQNANIYAGLLFGTTLIILILVYFLNKRFAQTTLK